MTHQGGQAFLLRPKLTIHKQSNIFVYQFKINTGFIQPIYVITELVALLNSPLRVSRSRIFEIVDAIKTVTYVEVVHIDNVTDTLAWTLCKSRLDKAWSLVDCSSFVVMQQLGIQKALTTDQHFEQAGFIRLLK